MWKERVLTVLSEKSEGGWFRKEGRTEHVN